MKPSRKVLTAALALGLVPFPFDAARADGEQLVFVGFAGPRASLNTGVAGGTARTVYLRWDTTEGDLAAALPAGATLRLLRNGVEVRDFPAGLHSPTEAEVAAAYAGAANARRRAEMTTRLDAVVRGEAGSAGAPGSAVSSGNFDAALAAFLDVAPPVTYPVGHREQHEVWARTAARLDANIATLIGRGYIDTGAPAGVVRYDLVAVSGAVQKSLGGVSVDTGTEQVLGPAADLSAVTHDLGRCDAPEDGRVQGVVALTWDHSGPNRSTRFLNALATGGYDVWRTTDTCGPVAPPRDLRAEVAGRNPDANGEIALPGLVKVNGDTLIDISQPPADGREPTPNPRTWRAAFSQFLDDRKVLEAAGFEPGEAVCYYVVPRDTSGNYGQTQAIATRVGDTLDPPAPWDIEAVPESSRADAGGGLAVDDDRMVLRWASVDVPTYVADHRFDRAFCNLPQAQNTGRLVEAGDAGACGRGEGSTVNLDVDRYLIYRFDNEADAQAFTDSDGDGYADADERAGDGPGMACNAAAGPAGVNFKVAEIFAGDPMFRRMRGGRVEYEWADVVPAGTKGDVYFYRVAAMGRTPQQVGAPGVPVRALFPDETKPARPTEGEVFFGYCAPYAILDSHPEPVPESGGRYAAYDTLGLAAHVRFVCPMTRRDHEGPAGRAFGEIELVPEYADAPEGRRYAPFDSGLCQEIQQSFCAVPVVAEFLDADGRLLGAVQVSSEDPFGCERFANPEIFIPTLVQNQTLNDLRGKPRIGCDQDTGLVRPEDGDVVEGPITIALPLAAGECATVNVEREGQSFRLESKCAPFFDLEWDPPAEGGELSCVALYKTNKNNQPSAVLNLPCVKFRPKKAPGLPVISRFSVPGTGEPAAIEWYGPEQAIGGVIVEMWRAGGGDALRQTQFLGAEGRFGNGQRHENTLAHGAPALAGADLEEWCVQARSVGVGAATESGAQLSPLTQPLCVSRRAPAASLPTYLGWPTVPRPPQRSNLAAVYLTGDRMMAIPFSPVTYERFCALRPADNIAGGAGCDPLAVPTECTVGAPPPECRDSAQCVDPCLWTSGFYGGDTGLCALARGALGENTRFVAYRQSRDRSTGTLSPYEQVSPYLEKPFCRVVADLDPLDRLRSASFLNDPYLTLAPFDLGSGPQWHMTYVDRTPFIGGRDYRYQLVYFDTRGEIAAYADTQWITEVP